MHRHACQRASRTLQPRHLDRTLLIHHVPPQPERIRQQASRFHPLLSPGSPRLRTLSTGHSRRRFHQHHDEPYRCRLSCSSSCRFIRIICIDRRGRIASFVRPGVTFSILWTRNTGCTIAFQYDVVFGWRWGIRDSVEAKYQYRYRGQFTS